ncbi:lycopene beta-cyclase CrtY [Stutzerimonas tarimensis]|uniref:Lycopene beta-cyclase CrtY n=1 Tax=Stutzerimonas tarimensis TaxID=1507735 RepID=A0ABV7T347_9GAMM
MRPESYDLILVGGGLANGLIAWRLAERARPLRLLLLEQGTSLGGNHTWSFHEHDLSQAQHNWINPLVAHRWPHYEVIFPTLRRQLHSGYASITSERFDSQLRKRLGERVWLDSRVVALAPRQVTLADGRVLRAKAVIDGRGPRPSPHLQLGYQKFLGQELRLDEPHGLVGPVLMDASVAQHEGYRFVYLLPFSANRLLVEDTYYADGDQLSSETLRDHIRDYVKQQGWHVSEVLREEQGVLPITLSGDLEAYCRSHGGQPRSGLAAGLFHATTGYSLPHAVRLAEQIAGLEEMEAGALAELVERRLHQEWKRQGYFRLLNRMLFLAGRPEQRWQVMQRFYGLPEGLIQRFYAGDLRLADKLRILSGKPPVPLGEALRAMLAGRPGIPKHNG